MGPGPAGFAQAGLAEPPAAAGPAGASAAPTLVVRTRSSEHTLRGGTDLPHRPRPQVRHRVDDSRVSWRHGVLRVEGDEWLLEDVGSTNGTFVGPQRIDRVPIAVDCVVRLGNPDDGPILRCMPAAPTPRERQAEPAGCPRRPPWPSFRPPPSSP